MRVTVWGERFLEGESLPGRPPPINYASYIDEARRIYPDDIHEAIASALRGLLGEDDVVVTATLDDPGHGLTDEVLAATDVLIWWGHVKHIVVTDEEAERVCRRVTDDGMGLIMLHAGSGSKVFRGLMGKSCRAAVLRQGDDWEALWTVMPSHPIASGIEPVVVLLHEEMFGEYFDIPTPDDVVFISSFRAVRCSAVGAASPAVRGASSTSVRVMSRIRPITIRGSSRSWRTPRAGRATTHRRTLPFLTYST